MKSAVTLRTNFSPQVSRENAFARRVLARGAKPHLYRARIARTADDVRATQALRFSVFNLEHGEGRAESFMNGLDTDPFDAVCDHLLVEFTPTGEVIGTYRLQTGRRAAASLGYYSAQEFDLNIFEPIRSQFLELGRACIHYEHRNRGALGLLWRSIADYAHQHGARYLAGCSSLSSQIPAEGAAVFTALRPHYATGQWWTYPHPGCACPLDTVAEPAPRMPRLLAAYLSLGAKISAPPAIDREFGTIDFLTVLDLTSVPNLAAERPLLS